MQSQVLNEYRWENRILILVSGEKGQESFQKQREILLEEVDLLKERDLVLIYLKDDSVEFDLVHTKPPVDLDDHALRGELEITENFNGVILVGKDGGVKLREDFPVEPQKIFDLIDSMPMRRAEMKN